MKLKRQTSTTATPTYPATLEYGDLAVANNGVPAFGDKDNLPVPLGTAAEIKQINSRLDENAIAINGYSPHVFSPALAFSNGVATYTLSTSYTYLSQVIAQMNANTGFYVRATTINTSTGLFTIYAYDDAGNGLTGTLGVNVLIFRKAK